MIIFDKDRGFEMAVRALGGDYSPVRLGEPTGFNPFQAADTVESAAWLAKWMVGLLETGEGTDPLSEAQKEAVSKNVRANYHCLLYTSPSPRDQRGSRMPSSA